MVFRHGDCYLLCRKDVTNTKYVRMSLCKEIVTAHILLFLLENIAILLDIESF
jgi:hypothetical protein